MESTFATSCLFCTELVTQDAAKRHWFNVVLTSTRNFVIVPGIGPFCEGYLMAVTKDHYLNLAQLKTELFEELECLAGNIREVFSRRYRHFIVYEHGSSRLNAGGGCIDHAHLHFLALPEHLDILSILCRRHRVQPLAKLADLRELGNLERPYLFFEDCNHQMHIATTHCFRSQHMRRLVATALGRPDQWDYAVFPRHRRVRRMIETLTPWPAPEC